MQTTLDLADELMAAVTSRASQEGRTVASVVEEALRTYLAVERTVDAVEPLPSWGSPDGRVLVDLTDRDAVRAALDEPA